MNFIAGILTVVLVLNCVVLIFLVLIQLPKKDAGAGMAFGGGAADALFGAGSGNVLTKITKWATGIFFGLSLILGLVQVNAHRSNTPAFEKAVDQKQSQIPAAPQQQIAPSAPTNQSSAGAIPVTAPPASSSTN
jgi:preprotein translocase subunit SecG